MVREQCSPPVSFRVLHEPLLARAMSRDTTCMLTLPPRGLCPSALKPPSIRALCKTRFSPKIHPPPRGTPGSVLGGATTMREVREVDANKKRPKQQKLVDVSTLTNKNVL